MKYWILAHVLSGALSAGVSGAQLSRGCREANPLMPQRPALNVLAKTGTTIGLSVSFHLLDGKGHRTAARWLSAESIGLNVAVAVHDGLVRCR